MREAFEIPPERRRVDQGYAAITEALDKVREIAFKSDSDETITVTIEAKQKPAKK